MANQHGERPICFLEKKVYRFNLFYRWYHFITGGVFLCGAVAAHDLWVLSIGAALFSAFMIYRPLVTALAIDPLSVTLKTMFSERSVPRSSIAAIETVTGKGSWVIFRAIDGKELLRIRVDLFSFDLEWDEWLTTYKNLNDLSLFPPTLR
jgi:hypothetical protein